MGRIIVIVLSAVAVFYFFGNITGPTSDGSGPGTAPPSRSAPPKKTAQLEAKPAQQSSTAGMRTFFYRLAIPGTPAPQEISFEIPEEILNAAAKEMPLFNNNDIQQILSQDAVRMGQEVTTEKENRQQQIVNIINRDIMMKNGVMMTLKKERNGYTQHFQYWGTHQNKQTLGYMQIKAEEMLVKWMPYRNLYERQNFVARQTQYLAQYLPYSYYSYDLRYDHQTQNYKGYLRPDFLQIARVHRTNLYTLAQEIFKAAPEKEPRSLAAMALYFVQAIPVAPDDTQRDLTLRKTPFVNPTTMLVNNRGSADTKATTLASLLGILLPEYTVVMYLLPEHAAIGINLPAQEGDFVHQDPAGGSFVVMEPYGPGLMPIGHATDYTRKVLEKGLFSYFVVPQ